MRRRPVFAGLVVGALLGALALAMSGCNGSSSSADGTFSGTGTYQNVSVGFTQQDYPYIGKANAPITIEEFSDFLCPYCGQHFSQTLPALLKGPIAKGTVKYVFRDMPLASLHPTAPEGHAAARCVAEQGPGLFWAMHDDLFSTQDQWRNLPSPTQYLADAAKKIGADTAEYAKCVEAGKEKTWVEESIKTGTEGFKFNATPTFRFIQSAALAKKADPKAKGAKVYVLSGAYPLETFTKWVKALAAGKKPPEEQVTTSEPVKLPLWASAKGLAPDPARPGFTKAGDPYKGNPDAKMVVVEFSNFECPSCRRHALQTQPTLDKRFVDTGKVFWVFKNLPLRELPHSVAGAVAAECAGEQGRFWDMYKALFEAQARWAATPPDPQLERLAGQLGLDTARFSACLGSREAAERVLSDQYDAANVTTTTPAFVFLHGGKGGITRGARPAEEFAKLLQAQLDIASGKKPATEGPKSQVPSTP